MTINYLINELQELADSFEEEGKAPMEILIRDGSYVHNIGEIHFETFRLLPFWGTEEPRVLIIDLGNQVGGWREDDYYEDEK